MVFRLGAFLKSTLGKIILKKYFEPLVLCEEKLEESQIQQLCDPKSSHMVWRTLILRMPCVVSVINDNNAFVGLRENKTDEVKAKQK